MRRRDLLLLVALVGCAPADRDMSNGDGGPMDAAADAAIDDTRMPFTTTGTTPAGSLDDIRYLRVEYLDGFCEPGIYLRLYRTDLLFDPAVVTVFVSIPEPETGPAEPPTGVLAARAWVGDDWQGGTEDVSFEVVHVDLPPTTPLRLAGTVTANAAGWTLDLSFDIQTLQTTCI